MVRTWVSLKNILHIYRHWHRYAELSICISFANVKLECVFIGFHRSELYYYIYSPNTKNSIEIPGSMHEYTLILTTGKVESIIRLEMCTINWKSENKAGKGIFLLQANRRKQGKSVIWIKILPWKSKREGA